MIENIGTIVTIASILLAGINSILALVIRSFWKLTFEEHKNRTEKTLISLEKSIREHEAKNSPFRHDFPSVTQHLEQHITGEIKHLTNAIADLSKGMHESIDLKIALAISQSKQSRND